MPSHYKGGGEPPSPCFDSPIPPDLGNGPSGVPVPMSVHNAMVAPSDPFQSCCNDACCVPIPCCGQGGEEGGVDGIGGPPGLKTPL